MPQLLKRLVGPLPRLLVGEFGLATVYNGRYLGLSAAFINSKLACLPCLPHSTQVMVGKVCLPQTCSHHNVKDAQQVKLDTAACAGLTAPFAAVAPEQHTSCCQTSG